MTFLNKNALILISLFSLGGCAHSIQVAPPLDDMRNAEDIRKIDKQVGYYISIEDRAKEVTSPGGGGDKVTYFPYRDTEGALNTILLKTFSGVHNVKDMSDSEFISAKNISYIFTPSIKTDSSSSSALSWPPTDFEFELTCSAVDVDGNNIWQKTVSATGNAKYSEFKSDFSLSARRASAKAYEKMLMEISNAVVF